MIVPRAYSYTAPRSIVSPKQETKDDTATARPVAAKKERSRQTRETKHERSIMVPARAPMIPTYPLPIHSYPNGLRKNRNFLFTKEHNIKPESKVHEKGFVLSSVRTSPDATSIPIPKPIIRDWNGGERRQTREMVPVLEANNPEESGSAMSKSNPRSWDTLLSPPDDWNIELWSGDSGKGDGVMSSLRTFSSESIPSLDEDNGSPESLSSPGTPGRSRKRRIMLSSRGEDCVSDHPLLFDSQEHYADFADTTAAEQRILPAAGLPDPGPRSFKSNLTASIRLLKSAARSFAELTAPARREDFLCRSLVFDTPHFADEVRPPITTDFPDSALRRYLNPNHAPPPDTHVYHDLGMDPSKQDRCTASIQLQTYQRTSEPSDRASSPPIFVSGRLEDATVVLEIIPVARQREMRENGDFLRQVVMEMNMRRNGKFSEAAPWRARAWLPARQATIRTKTDGKAGTSHLWVGSVP